jgi:aminoglycoside phosphotransferase (APT) family kinase protein
MLDERGVADYLIARELVAPERVVAGDLEIRDASRRNRNYRVESRDGPSYLVKQAGTPDARATLAQEASAYRVLEAAGPAVARYVPAFHGFDDHHALLVLELVDSGRTLAEHQSRGRFSATLAREVGRALGTLHRESAAAARRAGQPPYALFIHRPTVGWLRDTSDANVQLVRLVQGAPALVQALDELRADWRVECLVHNDYKADNCVVVRDRSGRGRGIRLVDWEIAGPGDPAWDAGSVFGDYLGVWLSSIPITGSDPPERFAELARFPLARMRPALAAFWSAYSAAAGLDATTSDRRLVRSVRFAAARLLQTASEQTQYSPQLTGTTLCLAQVAANVLGRPHEAAVRLLGISLRGTAQEAA